jgi:hypothetical protein
MTSSAGKGRSNKFVTIFIFVYNVKQRCATQKGRSGIVRRDDCLSDDVTPRIFIEKRRGGNMFP